MTQSLRQGMVDLGARTISIRLGKGAWEVGPWGAAPDLYVSEFLTSKLILSTGTLDSIADIAATEWGVTV